VGRSLILDRDARYGEAFRSHLAREGIQIIREPPRSPNLNAYAERLVRSIKEEWLNRMIFFGQAQLRRAVTEHLVHYHAEPNHQGMDNRLLQPSPAAATTSARVRR
jgi:putative transposase